MTASGVNSDIVEFPVPAGLQGKILACAETGLAIVSLDGLVIYANAALVDLLRLPMGGLAINLFDFLVQEHDCSSKAVRDLAAGHLKRLRLTLSYSDEDGETHWRELTMRVTVREGQSDPEHILIEALDIDKCKQTEIELESSEWRWKFALEGAGQGVWDHDLRNNRYFFSPTWKSMRGLSSDAEVDGSFESWIARVHPEDRERIRNLAAQQDAGILPYNEFEYRERRADGEWIWILSRGRAVEWNGDGSVARILGTDTDITSLKQSEARLAQEKEFLRTTLELIGEGLIILSPEGKISFLNPTAERMTGSSLDDVLELPLHKVFKIFDIDDGTAADPLWKKCSVQKSVVRSDLDVRLESRKGESCFIRHTASPVMSRSGELLAIMLVFQDTTDRQKLEKDLQHAADHDSLTGLYNRGAFERHLNAAILDSNRSQCLLFVDLDGFKSINDRAGHAAGDLLLKRIAKRLLKSARNSDVVARLGGDEFAVLLDEISLKDAEILAQRLRKKIALIEIEQHGVSYSISASIGVAKLEGVDSIDTVLNRADIACYQSKHSGKNQVVVAA